jgi:ATP-dependent DNA helicase PIF1
LRAYTKTAIAGSKRRYQDQAENGGDSSNNSHRPSLYGTATTSSSSSRLDAQSNSNSNNTVGGSGGAWADYEQRAYGGAMPIPISMQHHSHQASSFSNPMPNAVPMMTSSNHGSLGGPTSSSVSSSFSSSTGSYHNHPPSSNTQAPVYTSMSSSSSYSPEAMLSSTLISALTQHMTVSETLPLRVTLPHDEHGTLNDEQRLVIESILSGYNVFFTGPAGSGKSHILSTLQRLNDGGGRSTAMMDMPTKKIVVTATTGIAACSIGGVTIHSFAGCGVGLQTKSSKTFEQQMAEICGKITGNQGALKRWRETDILVIDEISMMSSGFLDMLDAIAKRTRNNRQIFGGMQLVVCGDFFQLPPVDSSKKNNSGSVSPLRRRGASSRNMNGFAFEADCWCQVIQRSVLLKQIFRQGGDKTFMKILNEARVGELSDASVIALRRHSMLPPAARSDSGEAQSKIKATKLECRNTQVDQANVLEMKRLPAEERVFVAKDMALHRGYDAQLRQCAAPETLRLKVGAQVILLKNIDPARGLVNGSRGVVVDYQKPDSKNMNDLPRDLRHKEYPVVQFDSMRPTGSIKDDDEEQQVDETADSHNKENNSKSKKMHKKKMVAAKKNADNNREELRIVATPEEWASKMGDVIVCARVQVPLRLAWALSVHKSQGMTIPHLEVSLRGVFEYGQAYVALSRGTSLDTLTLKCFNPKAFVAHPRVKAFYRLLEGKDPYPNVAVLPQAHSVSPYAPQGDGAGVTPPPSFAQLNPEQKRRLEENRKRALALRQAKAAKVSTHPSNPYLKRNC